MGYSCDGSRDEVVDLLVAAFAIYFQFCVVALSTWFHPGTGFPGPAPSLYVLTESAGLWC